MLADRTIAVLQLGSPPTHHALRMVTEAIGNKRKQETSMGQDFLSDKKQRGNERKPYEAENMQLLISGSKVRVLVRPPLKSQRFFLLFR
jgi:hypothetical protein